MAFFLDKKRARWTTRCHSCDAKKSKSYKNVFSIVTVNRRLYQMARRGEKCTTPSEVIFASWNGDCHLCKEQVNFRQARIEHSHLTRLFRGWTCPSCNTAVGNYETGRNHWNPKITREDVERYLAEAERKYGQYIGHKTLFLPNGEINVTRRNQGDETADSGSDEAAVIPPEATGPSSREGEPAATAVPRAERSSFNGHAQFPSGGPQR
jgi:hypothetical protein